MQRQQGGSHGHPGEVKENNFEISGLKSHLWKEMGGLQGLLLLLFLTAVSCAGLSGAFLKMLGTHSELAHYPHSQRLQQAEQVLSSWLDPAWAAMGKAFYQLSLG